MKNLDALFFILEPFSHLHSTTIVNFQQHSSFKSKSLLTDKKPIRSKHSLTLKTCKNREVL